MGRTVATPPSPPSTSPSEHHAETRLLSVVLPAYEEAGSIRAGKLAQVMAWAAKQIPPAEVLVVDDGSCDDTAKLAEAASARLLSIPHGGKASALGEGIRAAKGEWVIVCDMDQATPIEESPKLLALLDAGADIALGSRGWRRPGAPLARVLLSLGHWGLQRILVGLPWRDTQCGFKAFRRRSAIAVLSGLQRYGGRRRAQNGSCVSSGFDVEFLLVARSMGLSIAEVPVAWRYQETRRVAKLRDSLRGAADLIALAGFRLRGRYGGKVVAVERVEKLAGSEDRARGGHGEA